MLLNQLDPAVHRVVETEQGRYLRRELKLPELFTYHFLPTGTWVVAIWADGGHKDFRELKSLRDIRELDRDAVSSLRAWANKKTKTVREVFQEQQEAERARERDLADKDREANHAKKFLKKEFRRVLGSNACNDPNWGVHVQMG